MKKECAWCGKDMGEVDGHGVEGTTSGICEECLKKELAKIKENKAPILCVPLDANPAYLVPGVAVLNCTDCSRQIFVAPSSMEKITNGEAYPLCPKCFRRCLAEHPGPHHQESSPLQLKEINDYFRRN